MEQRESNNSLGNEKLSFLLNLQQECGGIISFERYMREALYHPVHGYYSKNIETVGAEGDFSTSVTLDPGLGPALAAWITMRAQEMGWERIPVIEIGAGNGDLAKSVLRHLNWRVRFRIDYIIHETSPVLEKEQKKRLHFCGIRWIRSLPEALNRSYGRALIFSNELVDAFPCKLFQKVSGEWHELGVSISKEHGLSEKIVSTTPSDPWFSQFGSLPLGQRVERIDSYRKWLNEWSTHWREGTMLTIDYGETAEHLYKRRLEGSLRAYWWHQRLTGAHIFARFGKQDLTADVNFSDLIRWGEEQGWKTMKFETQGEFIESWMRNKISRSSLHAGVGVAFKVLEQYPSTCERIS